MKLSKNQQNHKPILGRISSWLEVINSRAATIILSGIVLVWGAIFILSNTPGLGELIQKYSFAGGYYSAKYSLLHQRPFEVCLDYEDRYQEMVSNLNGNLRKISKYGSISLNALPKLPTSILKMSQNIWSTNLELNQHYRDGCGEWEYTEPKLAMYQYAIKKVAFQN